ncbi:hypothetical protein [Pseudobacteriovorax antillogorgiicola]|uniref:Uncharacterized protein n=1 Tax=Pseudobacteriovorax antillogorgiicola TaxID=1513793 RepID=A0A1Y6CNU8_9BACT|nr:hypothetical protein [Pseudobacteriovorax antillogorgiicola]TCS44244.1 hypothetical protein EDD56_13444 [Pseudobacteriovorax antillogorgiicola]SMF80705.1 hypothetical protein SAMN06296036_13545 [Pseudobacteriovorax antillogorgiicola]
MKLFNRFLTKFSKDTAPGQDSLDESDGEELLLFYLRTKSGFASARKYVTALDRPRLVAIQFLVIPGAPYASIVFDRAILLIGKLDEQARRHYKELRFADASDGESFMSSLEVFIEVIGWTDEKLPSEHEKALLYRAWRAHRKMGRVSLRRPIDDLDGKNRILSFGSPGMFPFTFSELKKQFDLEKRWFIAGRYLMFTFAAQKDGKVLYYTVLTITGNDLFVLNCFSNDREVMVHRGILNDIFESLTPNGFKKISDYMVHYGRKFQLSGPEKAYLVSYVGDLFDVARDDLLLNQANKADESMLEELRGLQKETSWEPLIG